jgi:DNA-binding transcriptional regulator YiaG
MKYTLENIAQQLLQSEEFRQNRELTLSSLGFTASDLKAARDERGMSQAKVAEQLGISKRAVEDWERGVRTPARYTPAQAIIALAFLDTLK